VTTTFAVVLNLKVDIVIFFINLDESILYMLAYVTER